MGYGIVKVTATAVLRSAGIHYHRPLGHCNPFARNDNILVNFFPAMSRNGSPPPKRCSISYIEFYIEERKDLFFFPDLNLGKEPDLKTHLLQVKGSRFKRTQRGKKKPSYSFS